MVTPINTSNNTVKTDIFYINDVHGQVPKMERLANASDAFDEFVKTYRLKAGDGMYIPKEERVKIW